MTLEDFAHRCLMIKAGNAALDIPCCANCKYYKKWNSYPSQAINNKYVCYQPELVWRSLKPREIFVLDMKPEDFCSRWESRNEEKEVKEKNKKTRKRT